MGRVVVLGEQVRVAGYALAGAEVLVAEDDGAACEAFDGLADDVEVVILTAAAARALGQRRTAGLRPLTVVMPS